VRVVAIVQARLGSTRLPRKVLEPIAGRSMLDWVVSRARAVERVTQVVVATTAADHEIAAQSERLGVECVRGSEHDVLDRYAQAARASSADVVVRITADCPLLDPDVSSLVVRRFLSEQPDYASNGLVGSFPRGLDTEVFTREALEIAQREATRPYEREHVTPFLWQQPDRFRLLSIADTADHSDLRLTVDTADDLALVRAIHERLGAAPSYPEILALFAREPALARINAHVEQKKLGQ
jgi:spore coat polysaccharide biosynthesis protein SpsF